MRYRILVVEDQPIYRELFRQALAQHYDISEAADADTGLQMATAFKPHLMIIDIELPGMNGLAMLEQLSKMPALAHTEYVIVTVREEEEFMRKAAKLGVANYLTKPIDADELQEVVAMLLHDSV